MNTIQKKESAVKIGKFFRKCGEVQEFQNDTYTSKLHA